MDLATVSHVTKTVGYYSYTCPIVRIVRQTNLSTILLIIADIEHDIKDYNLVS